MVSKTSKATYTKSGISFYQALKQIILEREDMRDTVRKKLLGITDDEAEQKAVESLTVTELFENFKVYKINLPEDNSREKHWNGAYAQQMKSVYKTLDQATYRGY